MRSLRVGEAWSARSQVGPLVGPSTIARNRALTRLEPGESWLVEARRITDRLWRPGVRLGVQPASWSHTTEWFGPVLGIMRARDLEEALRWQNAVDFGLTAGLSSLDPDEHRHWAEKVEAGNLYLNRPTTGAVVGRQPFGGWKASSLGPTAKAGGPNYLIGLRRWSDDPSSPVGTAEALSNYHKWWQQYFSRETELAGLRSESNVLRYRPYTPGVLLRLGAGTDDEDLRRALELSSLTGTPLAVSSAGPLRSSGGLEPSIERVESDDAFAAGLASAATGTGARLRLVGTASATVHRAAARAGLSTLDEPLCSCGRIELVRWLREQVVTRSLHRYGNIVYTPAEMGPVPAGAWTAL